MSSSSAAAAKKVLATESENSACSTTKSQQPSPRRKPLEIAAAASSPATNEQEWELADDDEHDEEEGIIQGGDPPPPRTIPAAAAAAAAAAGSRVEADGIMKQQQSPPSRSNSNRSIGRLSRQRSGRKHASSNKKRTVPLPRIRRKRHHAYNVASFEDSDDADDRHYDAHASNNNNVEEDSVTGNWSIDDDDDDDGAARATPTTTTRLNETDIAIFRNLDMEYERALEDRQVAWTARYQSVRQSTLFSVLFMLLLMLTGTTFFLRQADSYWSVSEGLLFTIYTITTVGYGHLDMPDTVSFQLYTMIFIFLGIAMLTILVAQVYQCVALEASRVASNVNSGVRGHPTRTAQMRQWLEARVQEQRELQQQQQQQQNQNQNQQQTHNNGNNNGGEENWADIAEWILQKWDSLRTFLREDEIGRAVSVVLPFAILIALGAAVLGPLEGWSTVESLYFAVVSLTTVGFGDYYPTRPVSIWFCCLWLPFSVGFMSLYLANVAAFYIRLSDRNVARIERVLRRRLQRLKEQRERERRAVLRRALRGQQQQQQQHPNANNGGDSCGGRSDGNNGGEDDDGGGDCDFVVASAERAAATSQRPQQTDKSSLGVDRLGKQERLRQTANRLRGFDTVPTLDHSNHEDGVLVDGGPSYPRRNTASSLHSQESGEHQNHADRNLFGTEGSANHRRERILNNSMKHTEFVSKDVRKQPRASMATMKDVLQTVHRNNEMNREKEGSPTHSDYPQAGPESEFLSIKSNRTVLHHDRRTVRKKPSFALRALVQERFAEIIATDIAGYQSNIEIKEYTLSVTIQSLKQTADKWLVPRRARKAFRAVAFEALYFVGEHGLITRGADALFSLTPFEFHQIFSPLLAALGDAETMALWLENTQALAEVDLGSSSQPLPDRKAAASKRPQVEEPALQPDNVAADGDEEMRSDSAKPAAAAAMNPEDKDMPAIT